MRRHRLHDLAGDLPRRHVGNIPEAQYSDHPLLIVEHWQAADLPRFHDAHGIFEVFVITSKHDALGHHVADRHA